MIIHDILSKHVYVCMHGNLCQAYLKICDETLIYLEYYISMGVL